MCEQVRENQLSSTTNHGSVGWWPGPIFPHPAFVARVPSEPPETRLVYRWSVGGERKSPEGQREPLVVFSFL